MRRALFLVPTTELAKSLVEETAEAIFAELHGGDSIRAISSSAVEEKSVADRITTYFRMMSPVYANLETQPFNILGSDRCGSSSPVTIMGQVDAFREQVVVIVASEATIEKIYRYLCDGYGYIPDPIKDKKMIQFIVNQTVR